MKLLLILIALPAVLNAVHLKTCGRSESFKLLDFKIHPKKIHLPGRLTVSGKFQVTHQIGGNLKLQVSLKKKVFFAYVKVPCVSNYGSCTYHNGCHLLKKVMFGNDCPKEVTDIGLSCECPFKPGVFQSGTHVIDLPELPSGLGLLGSGKYKVEAKLIDSDTGKEHVCVYAEAEVA